MLTRNFLISFFCVLKYRFCAKTCFSAGDSDSLITFLASETSASTVN